MSELKRDAVAQKEGVEYKPRSILEKVLEDTRTFSRLNERKAAGKEKGIPIDVVSDVSEFVIPGLVGTAAGSGTLMSTKHPFLAGGAAMGSAGVAKAAVNAANRKLDKLSGADKLPSYKKENEGEKLIDDALSGSVEGLGGAALGRLANFGKKQLASRVSYRMPFTERNSLINKRQPKLDIFDEATTPDGMSSRAGNMLIDLKKANAGINEFATIEKPTANQIATNAKREHLLNVNSRFEGAKSIDEVEKIAKKERSRFGGVDDPLIDKLEALHKELINKAVGGDIVASAFKEASTKFAQMKNPHKLSKITGTLGATIPGGSMAATKASYKE